MNPNRKPVRRKRVTATRIAEIIESLRTPPISPKTPVEPPERYMLVIKATPEQMRAAIALLTLDCGDNSQK